MTVLVLVAIGFILLSLLGFTGLWAAVRSAAWGLLLVAIALLALSYVFR